MTSLTPNGQNGWFTINPATGSVNITALRSENATVSNVMGLGTTSVRATPTATPSQSPAANSAGWNNGDVTVNWNWSDNVGDSGLNTSACPASSTSSGEGTLALTATCKDLAGNQGCASYTVKVDKTAPTLSPVVSPNPVVLGASASASPNASDALAGVASASCGAVDTSSVGAKTVTCTATDNAGNTRSASASYQVIYAWTGFLQPIDSLPTVNSVKAGSAVPVRFSLGGNYDLKIFAAGSPSSKPVVCASGAPVSTDTSTVTASTSGLQYDGTTGTYTYTWKTDKSWAVVAAS